MLACGMLHGVHISVYVKGMPLLCLYSLCADHVASAPRCCRLKSRCRFRNNSCIVCCHGDLTATLCRSWQLPRQQQQQKWTKPQTSSSRSQRPDLSSGIGVLSLMRRRSATNC
jgi:hypothetical protein